MDRRQYRKRLELIEKKFADTSLNFAGALMSVYRHSSEIIHGTYFGTIHFWTAGTGRKPNREVIEWFLFNHLITVISSTFFSIRGAIAVIATKYEFDDLKKVNQELLVSFGKYVEKHFGDTELPSH